MTSHKKAIAAAKLLKQYCGERGCNPECKFCHPISKTCSLKVSSPDKFVIPNEKKGT